MGRDEQNYSAAMSQVSQYDALANMTLVAAGSPLGALPTDIPGIVRALRARARRLNTLPRLVPDARVWTAETLTAHPGVDGRSNAIGVVAFHQTNGLWSVIHDGWIGYYVPEDLTVIAAPEK